MSNRDKAEMTLMVIIIYVVIGFAFAAAGIAIMLTRDWRIGFAIGALMCVSAFLAWILDDDQANSQKKEAPKTHE